MTDTRSQIRKVLAQHGRLSLAMDDVSDTSDLFLSGMTSHSSVNVMLGLEAEFGLEFPDAMLKRSVFETIDSIADAIDQLKSAAA